MREEWYVVPARYAFKLREVVDPAPQAAPEHDAPDDDELVEGLYAATDDDVQDPPPPRHLPRKSSGHLKR